MINYIKGFKNYIPSWVICFFAFFWFLGWPLAIAIILLMIQLVQRRRINNSVISEQMEQLQENETEIEELKLQCNSKDETIRHLQGSIYEKDRLIDEICEKDKKSMDELTNKYNATIEERIADCTKEYNEKVSGLESENAKKVEELNNSIQNLNEEIGEKDSKLKWLEEENYNDTVQFTKIPIASEYRQSINMQ